jgi:GT2 family glycosyltransferase
MKTCVVIPTVDRTFFVLNMVMALRAGGRTPDEIIVIDQTTPEDRNPIAFAALKDHERRGLCRVIEYSVKSLTNARNVGVLSSDADLLIFVDDDAFVAPDFVEAWMEVFGDEKIDAATGMIMVSEADRGAIDTSRIQPSIHDGYTMVRGGNFAVRRRIMLELGGLDENFVGAANHEDADLAFRLHQHGCKVVWAPRPWLFHLCYREGGGRIRNPRATLNLAYNMFYFHLRHGILTPSKVASLLRLCVFNRKTVTHPWLLLPRLVEFIRSYRMAAACAAAGPKLPLRAAGSEPLERVLQAQAALGSGRAHDAAAR